nr:MAG TPA: hypothetical protein [Caudoviricetes sp.]
MKIKIFSITISLVTNTIVLLTVFSFTLSTGY